MICLDHSCARKIFDVLYQKFLSFGCVTWSTVFRLIVCKENIWWVIIFSAHSQYLNGCRFFPVWYSAGLWDIGWQTLHLCYHCLHQNLVLYKWNILRGRAHGSLPWISGFLITSNVSKINKESNCHQHSIKDDSNQSQTQYITVKPVKPWALQIFLECCVSTSQWNRPISIY